MSSSFETVRTSWHAKCKFNNQRICNYTSKRVVQVKSNIIVVTQQNTLLFFLFLLQWLIGSLKKNTPRKNSVINISGFLSVTAPRNCTMLGWRSLTSSLTSCRKSWLNHKSKQADKFLTYRYQIYWTKLQHCPTEKLEVHLFSYQYHIFGFLFKQTKIQIL